MITIISLSNDTQELPIVVSNWSQLNDQTKELILSCSDYRVMNSQEMLVYNGRKIVASCMIDILEDNKLYIENCYTTEGKLF
jgi:hypothetical protein